MFSREVADALRDVLPSDTVEVVNLGIAATNSYAILDFSREIIDQHPDAVMIYAGHNEYYGALGVGRPRAWDRFLHSSGSTSGSSTSDFPAASQRNHGYGWTLQRE
jgi:lysophospholipase L1-like esterase